MLPVLLKWYGRVPAGCTSAHAAQALDTKVVGGSVRFVTAAAPNPHVTTGPSGTPKSAAVGRKWIVCVDGRILVQ